MIIYINGFQFIEARVEISTPGPLDMIDIPYDDEKNMP